MKFIISSISLPIFFIVLSVALGEEYVDYRFVPDPIPSGRVARALNSKCEKPGLICDDCKNIHFCDNQQSSSHVWTCIGKDETCNNGECSTTPSRSCTSAGSKKFICAAEGIFPDPSDCFKYHICVETINGSLKTKTDYARTCKGTDIIYSFNAKSGYCDKIEASKACKTYPVPICDKPAQTDPLVDNPSIYYICARYSQTTSPNEAAVLYPYLYLCENGKTYDKATYQCKAV